MGLSVRSIRAVGPSALKAACSRVDELMPLERAQSGTSERALAAFLVLDAEVDPLLVLPQVAHVVRGVIAKLAGVQRVLERDLQVHAFEVVGDRALCRRCEVAGAALKDLEPEVHSVGVVLDGPLALGTVVALLAREVTNVAVNVPHMRLQYRFVKRSEHAVLLVTRERLHILVHLVHVVVDARELICLKVAVVNGALVVFPLQMDPLNVSLVARNPCSLVTTAFVWAELIRLL